MMVFVRLGGKGVGAVDVAYAPGSTALLENDAKYSPAKFNVSSGFLSRRNCKKSAMRFCISGCCLI